MLMASNLPLQSILACKRSVAVITSGFLVAMGCSALFYLHEFVHVMAIQADLSLPRTYKPLMSGEKLAMSDSATAEDESTMLECRNVLEFSQSGVRAKHTMAWRSRW
jgi:hypothetical protein